MARQSARSLQPKTTASDTFTTRAISLGSVLAADVGNIEATWDGPDGWRDAGIPVRIISA